MTLTSRDVLLAAFPAGVTIPLILRHESRTGFSRVFEVLDRQTLSSYRREVGELLGLKVDLDRQGVVIPGTGMDMAFWLVYQLGLSLYGDGDAFSYELV